MIKVVLKDISVESLLKGINDLIDNNRIQTWEYDLMGDYTMTPPQWRAQAWMRPAVKVGRTIKFGIIKRRDVNISKEVYAVYHGRFAEMLLAHFDVNIESLEISPMLVTGIDIY
ncbi:MAG: hypothetical protein J6K01_00740 [Paludibacteraceae bacterium]|nr:hypothetical protein [Prevotella sp.]MBP3466125.1 hypothetical protein [Paludibacteraceae bacterium]